MNPKMLLPMAMTQLASHDQLFTLQNISPYGRLLLNMTAGYQDSPIDRWQATLRFHRKTKTWSFTTAFEAVWGADYNFGVRMAGDKEFVELSSATFAEDVLKGRKAFRQSYPEFSDALTKRHCIRTVVDRVAVIMKMEGWRK
jgi:hypothetical protein